MTHFSASKKRVLIGVFDYIRLLEDQNDGRNSTYLFFVICSHFLFR